MPKKILISGLINIETTLRVEQFPLHYYPVTYPFWGINTTVSGVGFNVSAALTRLGNPVRFLTQIGDDPQGGLVRESLKSHGIPDDDVLCSLKSTPQSVILFDGNGRRQIHVDLKDIQESHYDPVRFKSAINQSDAVVLCNLNPSRDFLTVAKEAGKPVFTDVHVISDIRDAYNVDFMRAADVLFLSNEHLPCAPEEFTRSIADTYPNRIIVIGLGGQGALLYVRDDDFMGRFPAMQVRPVVNTIGAGDALFSSFTHYYVETGDPYISLRKAIVFASYKIGENGAASGLLSESELENLYAEISVTN